MLDHSDELIISLLHGSATFLKSSADFMSGAGACQSKDIEEFGTIRQVLGSRLDQSGHLSVLCVELTQFPRTAKSHGQYNEPEPAQVRVSLKWVDDDGLSQSYSVCSAGKYWSGWTNTCVDHFFCSLCSVQDASWAWCLFSV